MAICRARSSSCRIGSSISLPDMASVTMRRTLALSPESPFPFPPPQAGEGMGGERGAGWVRAKVPAPRVLIALSAAVVQMLSGCGWAPLYGDTETGPGSEELRAIKVAPISERIGQRLEIALLNSLNPTGEPTTPRYLFRT